MKNDISNIIDLDKAFAPKNNTEMLSESYVNGVPAEVAARIDLVNVYGVDQKVVDSMTTSMVLTEHAKYVNPKVSKKANIDSILTEWAWRCDKGYPDYNNISDRYALQEVLDEMKIPLPFERIAEAPSSTSKRAPSTIEGSNTPELKEGLVIYFSTQPEKLIDLAFDKASDPNNDTTLTLPIKINQDIYGAKAASLVSNAIEYLNNFTITANNSKIYLNAISIAKYIQNEFGVLDETKIDRGVVYTQIRSQAVKLARDLGLSVDADKWCPADIYIYNNIGAAKQAIRADDLNIGVNSLNSMFSNEFNRSGGIVGISLKEEKAQGGKATSFKNILTRKDNYPDALTLSASQKSVMELMYNINILTTKNAKQTPILKIGYVAEAARILSTSKIQNADSLLKSLVNTLKATFLENYNSVFGPKGGFNKDKTRSAFKALQLSEIDYDENLFGLIDAFSKSYKADAIKVYTASRKSFIETLKRLNFKAPTESVNADSMATETLYKKSSCYLVAEYLLSGLNSEQLQLPAAYKSIIKQKNAFVALTSYAIGMAGISPTFFKLVGDSKGRNSHLDTFYGDGFLNVDEDTETKIIDTSEYKGFYVEFIANVTLSAAKRSEIKNQYKVTLDFRYAGDQLNIEVSELKAV